MDCEWDVEVLTCFSHTDSYAFGPGHGVDARCLWLETFEPLFSTSGTVCWCEDSEVVVGGQQLEDSGGSC